MGLGQEIKTRRGWILLGCCLGLVAAIAVEARFVWDGQGKEAEASDDFKDTRRHMRPQEPTTDFPIKSVRAAWDELKPDELVLGVTAGGESRAYPLNVLNDKPELKVLNDTLGGRPIAPTF